MLMFMCIYMLKHKLRLERQLLSSSDIENPIFSVSNNMKLRVDNLIMIMSLSQ